MKLIKVKDTSHSIFRNYDSQDNELEIFRFEEPEGYMVIRRSGEQFVIRISSTEDFQVPDELKKVLKPYLQAKVYMTIDANLSNTAEYMEGENLKPWFGYYDMSLEHFDGEMTLGHLQAYKGEEARYRYILGKAFEPMRSLHDFKPYDWYGENKEEAIKEFEEANQKGNFYGYVVDGKIVGAGIVIDNMIDIVGIDPQLQKKGYGRQLVRGIIKDMHNRDITDIKIGVVESNAHVFKLYSEEGFKLDLHKRMYKNY